MDRLHNAKAAERLARDIVRAAGLPMLSYDNPHVRRDIAKIDQGIELSPVLACCGVIGKTPLIIVDGYHRVCAVHLWDPDALMHIRLAELP